jgi:hypothetical protein
MLAEYNVTYFNMIIPLLYQYFSNAMVGQWDTLKLTLIMLLPDQVSNIVNHCFQRLTFYLNKGR